MSALTSSVVHTDPRGTSPDISMIPAPLMPVTSAHTSQRREVSTPGASSRTSRAEDAQPPFTGHRSRGGRTDGGRGGAASSGLARSLAGTATHVPRAPAASVAGTMASARPHTSRRRRALGDGATKRHRPGSPGEEVAGPRDHADGRRVEEHDIAQVDHHVGVVERHGARHGRGQDRTRWRCRARRAATRPCGPESVPAKAIRRRGVTLTSEDSVGSHGLSWDCG